MQFMWVIVSGRCGCIEDVSYVILISCSRCQLWGVGDLVILIALYDHVVGVEAFFSHCFWDLCGGNPPSRFVGGVRDRDEGVVRCMFGWHNHFWIGLYYVVYSFLCI